MDGGVLKPRRHGRYGGVIVALVLAIVALIVAPVSCRQEAPATLARTELRPAVNEPMIRVRIARSVEKISLTPRSRLLVLDATDAQRVVASVAGRASVALVDGGMALADARGARAVEMPPTVVLRESDGGPVVFDGAEHSGALELRAAEGSAGIDAIETVGLEMYVAGVFEAQAIAARSYALHERERRMQAGSRFHVESTTQDQAYSGATANPRALEATQRTRGMVLTFRGRILRTYYSSTCGGRAASARDTWPTGPGFEYNLDAPIQAHERDCPCGFSTRHRWTVERSASDLALRLAEHGKRAGMSIRTIESVAKIEAHRRNRVERPAAFEIFDRRGKSWLLSGEQFRLACNVEPDGLAPIDAKNRVLSSDVEVRIEGDRVAFSGRGFGHGVGMCQFGAEGLARDGRQARDILAHYYPGATLERAY